MCLNNIQMISLKQTVKFKKLKISILQDLPYFRHLTYLIKKEKDSSMKYWDLDNKLRAKCM